MNVWLLSQRVLAAVVLCLLTPLLALLFVLVKLTSRGPVLFRQQRRGLGGRPIGVYKIRSMRVRCDDDRELGVTRNHAGITRVGRWLREFKLDELPQLWNVVRGEMALVGPRPLPLPLERVLHERIPAFRVRERVLPGLTSVGQLLTDDNGVGDELIVDWRARALAERHYVRNRGVIYDLMVLGLSMLYLGRRVVRQFTPEQRSAGPATAVLGVPIANVDHNGVVQRVASWRGDSRRHYICVCPVHSVVEAGRDDEHRRALLGADLNTADGMPIVWSQRLLGYRGASRVYGPDLMLKLLAVASTSGWRVGFYGGRPEVLDELVARMRARWPRLLVVVSISPPFGELGDQEERRLAARLGAARPDLLFVGLGCPRQEKWMARHSELRCTMVGVGAAFDFHAGSVRQCPRWLQRLGLEWAFRLAMEPRRLFWRYASTNPVFCVRLAAQLVRRLVGRDAKVAIAETNSEGGA